MAVSLPHHLLQLSALDALPGITHNGFSICVFRREYDTPAFQDFVAAIVQSLDLIARHDPRRYKTVVRSIKTIAWSPLISSSGSYRPGFRVCVINSTDVFQGRAADVIEPSLYEVVCLASLLVHEATHGRVDTFFVPYDKQNREAIEKLCIKEEQRFMDRLYHLGVFPKVRMKPFSADDWKKYWKD